MRYIPPEASLFIRNRQKFAQKMRPGHIAVFFSSDLAVQNADSLHAFSQNSNTWYLTGIDQEDVVLLLFPDAPRKAWREVLFIRKTNKMLLRMEGFKYTADEAAKASGIKEVRIEDQFNDLLRSALPFAEGLYLDVNEHEGQKRHSYARVHAFADRIRQEYPGYPLCRAAPVLRSLRTFKEPEELSQIRIAGSITEKAFRRVLEFVRPGVWEFEVEAEILHEFIRNRATGPAFPSIVAAGGNACTLHYVQNKAQCQANDLLLLDFGAEYAHYGADVSRTIPVNGRFTARQKAIYNGVHRVLLGAKDRLVPGILLEDYQKEVAELMEQELLELGLLSSKEVREQDPRWPAYKKYFMHGTSHHLGLDTHDLCDRFAPLAPGMVLTVEPGIYVEAEGIGIRLENDVVITENGLEDLTQSIPLLADEVEDLMMG
ncbi:MAG TPA: M24 family metallopeptidase [Bacteroidetes bacterium]|nr:M24 family metallopeptidase [Bacteroidota bacterium]